MQSTTTHGDPHVFPEPNSFDPGRWIANGSIFQGTAEMREMLLTWGKGSRLCLGQYMAMMELKILVSRLTERCLIQLEGESTHVDMEMLDYFVIQPKGSRCRLVFRTAKS
jgi:cytochrome P450